MRVIAGSARRLQLRTIEGTDTRPTTDRIKETLFNIIAPGIYGCTFLDLFAGSGGIGIEALSRGAEQAVFVEYDPRAMACIKANLEHTRLADRAVTVQADFRSALSRMKGKFHFDYVFMDPPYGKGLEREALAYLADATVLNDGCTVIAEASLATDFAYAREMGYSIAREKVYKTNKHVFLEKDH